jgi:hypothetical protein
MIVKPATGPDWCWWCGGKLAKVIGSGGALHATLIKDGIGNEHRCHATCAKTAQAMPLTANECRARRPQDDEAWDAPDQDAP